MKKYVFGLGSAQVLGIFSPTFFIAQSIYALCFLFICRLTYILMWMMQVLVTAVVIGLVTHFVSRLPGPAAIVIGNGLALSSTAVVLQVA
jgi:hypothetical protein